MSRPHRRMLALPGAQELTQGPTPIRLRKKKDRFLFMTYNLLAQALVRRDMFPHASQKALRWKFRKQNLLQEFLAYGPDLACLQEVDFWEETYLPALTKAGYETAYYKNSNKKHGCAIVWRKTRFEKVDQSTIEYDDIGQPTFTTGNIALLVGLKPIHKTPENADPNADMVLPDDDEEQNSHSGIAEGEESEIPGGILVATTHLFWRPDGSYERLRQASILLEKIKEWNSHLNYTVLLGGDFNTTPRDAAYRAMTRNEMPPQQMPNLENWLKEEVGRLLEAVEEGGKETAESEKKESGDAAVKALTAQASKLDLEPNISSSSNDKDNDRPYPAPPTGIKLPVQNSNHDKAAESTQANAADFATSNDPKIKKLAAPPSGEDAPVLAPLDAFTPPRDLLAGIEALPRCISIYSQYETLIRDSPPPPAHVVPAPTDPSQPESTASPAPTQHTHGEPAFTNFANWFKDTLDYVYLLDQERPPAGARLVPLKLLEIPAHEYLGHGLPDENFSSDHLCLLVEFAILAQ